MSPQERAQFLLDLANRIGAVCDVAEVADVPFVVVDISRDEIRMALDIVGEDTSDNAVAVRAIFQRALRQMSADEN